MEVGYCTIHSSCVSNANVSPQCQGFSSSSRLKDIEKVLLILSMCGGVGGFKDTVASCSLSKKVKNSIIELDVKR
jgi:hypothetical protein